MFDFNFDGIQEIVFRDDTFLRIFNGSVIPPIEISKSLCYSNTYLEYPVIGDIDHSGLAKICVPCGSLSNVAIGKLTVFGSPIAFPAGLPPVASGINTIIMCLISTMILQYLECKKTMRRIRMENTIIFCARITAR